MTTSIDIGPSTRALSDRIAENAIAIDKRLNQIEEKIARLAHVVDTPIRELELDDPNDDPQTLAEANRLIARLQIEVMEAMLRGMVKNGWLPSDGDKRDPDEEKEPEPLPDIVDSASVTVYVATVTRWLQSKRITPQECRSLLYAAQVALQGLKTTGQRPQEPNAKP